MANSVLVLGSRLVDLEAGIVSGGGEPVLLSQRDFGYSERSVSRAVDMTVKRLRMKLEDDPSTPEFLLTEYGTGYSLRVGVQETRAAASKTRRSPRMEAVLSDVRAAAPPVWVRLVPGEDPDALNQAMTEEGHTVLVLPPFETTSRLPTGVVVLACDPAPFGWSEVTVPALTPAVCRALLGVDEDPWGDALVAALEGCVSLVELALIMGVGWAQLSLGFDVRAVASFRQVRHAAQRAGECGGDGRLRRVLRHCPGAVRRNPGA